MKKKILLITVAMALFVCLFAMGTYAAGFESSYDVSVEAYDTAPDWANVTDKEATSVLALANGDFVRVPTYCIFKASGNNQFYILAD